MKTVPPYRSPRRGARADWQLSRPTSPAGSHLDDLLNDSRTPWRPGFYKLGLQPPLGMLFVERIWINSYDHRDELLAGYEAGGLKCDDVDWDGVK